MCKVSQPEIIATLSYVPPETSARNTTFTCSAIAEMTRSESIYLYMPLWISTEGKERNEMKTNT